MMRPHLPVLGWMILALALAAPAAAAAVARADADPPAAAIYYVGPAGNDLWTGRRPSIDGSQNDGPWATLAGARNALRKLRADGTLTGGVRVQIRGGTYFLSEPLVLGPEDGGSKNAPVIWEAFPGEKPVLSGGQRITGFSAGVGGLWSAEVPGVKEGKVNFRQLFVNGRRAARPRLPGDGYFRVVSMPGVDMIKANYRTGSDKFEFKPGDLLASWANPADIEVVVLHFWVDTHLPVKSIDEAKNVVTFDRRSVRKFTDDYTKAGARYYVENVREALDKPGQWYLDRPAGRVLYLPRPGEDMTRAEVIAPRAGQLVRLQGDSKTGKSVDFVTLRGLTFSHTEYTLPRGNAGDLQAAQSVPGAVWLGGARDCAVTGCTVTHAGTYGIELANGCRRVAVTGNELVDLGGGGIRLSGGVDGSPEAERTAENTITDNHVHDCGQVWHSAVGILLQHAAGNTIAYNHVHHLYYTGISVGWIWGYKPSVSRDNVIEYNHIHDIGQGVLSDMGAIYMLGPSPGTVVRNNHIHDILASGYGGWGIYTDEGSSNIVIESNLVYRTKTGGFHQHYGKENIVRNNIFALTTENQIERSRMEPHTSFTFERNIVYWKTGQLLGKNWKDDKFVMDYNVYWNATGAPVTFAGVPPEEWHRRGHDQHSIIADPLFMDPDKDDFRLKPASPAFKVGFKPFDVSAAGVRKAAK